MSKRTLKYRTISKSGPAPVAGSVMEEKDTIFVKQVTDTEFEVYASDEEGYVVKLHEKTMTNDKFRELLLVYIESNSAEIKNALNHSEAIPISVKLIGLAEAKVKVLKVDGKERIYTLKSTSGPLYLDEGDRVMVNSSLYPNEYVAVNDKIVGKDLNREITIDPVGGITFELVNTSYVDENSGVMNVVNIPDGVNVEFVPGGGELANGTFSLNRGYNNVPIISNVSEVTLRFTGLNYAGFELTTNKGGVLINHSPSSEGSVEYSVPVESLGGLSRLEFADIAV